MAALRNLAIGPLRLTGRQASPPASAATPPDPWPPRTSGDQTGHPARTTQPWVRNSCSGAEGGQCVEVAAVPGAVLVRDSTCPADVGPAFGPEAWAGFVDTTAGH
ncbi:DUF397 domain-containing protein [Streptomyces sp. NPDC058625]|uniref:DUF397 domain-containing protein n=1 Tax=Streptomyces sp. NPDC058625 TaxID=3346564 RepID=UPI00365D09FF